MENNYEFKDLFDADKNLTEFGQQQRAKIMCSSLYELEKMPQVKTNQ